MNKPATRRRKTSKIGGKRGRGSKKTKAATRRKNRGGGLLESVVGLRNVKYINLLEKRLVNNCDDYEWVQEQRVSSMRMRREKKDYK
tara:strand:+ start:181 stop:441 length:261 start_codon:yes stop_codon:yes gene_type:complete